MRPTRRPVLTPVELLEAPHLLAARGGVEASAGARLQAGDVLPQRAGEWQTENVIDMLGQSSTSGQA
jgi:hypothetical protein